MRRPILLLLAAVVLSVVAVVLVVTLDPFGDDPAPSADEPFATTPLAEVDTTLLTVPRIGFCAAVHPREVTAALGAEPTTEVGYDNGDEVTLPDGTADIAHEFGCSWSLEGGSTARAWVFAPPVDRARAVRMAREASRTEGCRTERAPSYGDPTVALFCTDDTGSRVSFRGLFGDAWLTCELALPAQEQVGPLVDRTGAWCSGVARGAAG